MCCVVLEEVKRTLKVYVKEEVQLQRRRTAILRGEEPSFNVSYQPHSNGHVSDAQVAINLMIRPPMKAVGRHTANTVDVGYCVRIGKDTIDSSDERLCEVWPR